jgi:hypothetical protein
MESRKSKREIKLKTELQKQRDFVKKIEEEKLPCFNCKHPFNIAESEIGAKHSNVHQCPNCELFFQHGLAFFGGEAFWYPLRDMELLSTVLLQESFANIESSRVIPQQKLKTDITS